MYYIELFLAFLYFKITRVHRKEEIHNLSYKSLDLVMVLDGLYLIIYGILQKGLIETVSVSFLFFILAALMITAVQVGIFFDGKPLFGISKVYKLLLILPVVVSFGILFL